MDTLPHTPTQRPVVDVADTHQAHDGEQRVRKHVSCHSTRVHGVRRVEVDQGDVTGRGRGRAANGHQLEEIAAERVDILRCGILTLILIIFQKNLSESAIETNSSVWLLIRDISNNIPGGPGGS